jgi:LuxR family quorum-sensing system transcriptional regulator CciR
MTRWRADAGQTAKTFAINGTFQQFAACALAIVEPSGNIDPMKHLKIGDSELSLRAFNFAMAARQFTAMNELSAATLNVIAPLGMTAAASGLVSGSKAASANPFHFANWPADWIALYLAEGYLLVDPLPRWARNSGRTVTWHDLFNALSERDPGRRVIEAGARCGFTEGIVVPMRSGDNSLGLVSFGGARLALAPIEQTFLMVVARSTFEAADRIENSGEVGQAAPILTAREIECLVLLARGHNDNEAGKVLGLSVRTIRFHLANARVKFRASSRTHLAALAIAQGYVIV